MKVIPRAAKSEVVGSLPDGSLKVKVTVAPERGKANQEVCDLLAKHFNVPKSQVKIASGNASRLKRVEIIYLKTN